MFPKRGAIALVTTVLALVLLLSFKTPDPVTSLGVAGDGAAAVSGTTAIPTPTATTGTSGTTSGGTGSTPAGTASPAPTAATAATTVTGSTIRTRYGNVAVQITVAGGQVTDIQAVALPTRGRSGQISDYVAPILASEALRAQSAKIDIVSGATYTSVAYAESLQSALDQAGIAAVTAPFG
jgi:uncharacterized protein with FMN-binding domain